MCSEKQLAANRLNSLKSTGPRTPEGKANVRRNALTHGLRAETLLLPHEDAKEFEEFSQKIADFWQPQNVTEQMLISLMSESYWRMLRANRIERGHYSLTESTYAAVVRARG